MATKHPEILPGTLEMLILKALTHGPNHGYGIAQWIHKTSEGVLRIGEGSLYPALQRLLANGWVEAEWSTSETGHKIRLYTIKRAGRKHLAEVYGGFNFLLAGIMRVMDGA